MDTLLSRFLRYFMTGGIAAIVDIGGFGLLTYINVQTLVAAMVSFIIAAIVNYQLSSRYVFDHKPTQKHFYQFLLIAVIGLCINVTITMVLMRSVEGFPMLAKVVAIAITFMINFLLNNFIVFKK